jgi:cbb3-type cytochrome oxidase subunit 3
MGHAGLSAWAEAALILFMAAFLVIAVRTFWPSRRAEMDDAARLPLEDEHPGTPRSGANE